MHTRTHTRADLRPPVGEGWECREGPIENTGMPTIPSIPGKPVPAWGPAGGAKTLHGGLSDYFLMAITEEMLQQIADWPNACATAPVKIVRKTRNRIVCKRCALGGEGQVHRCGTEEDKGEWAPLSKWNILSIFGVLIRAGALKMSTPAKIWVEYDKMGDTFTAGLVSKKKFLMVMRYLAFADHDDLEMEEVAGKGGAPPSIRMAKDAKVKPFLKMLQERFPELWGMPQTITGGEACCKSKPQYCGFKQRSPAKPMRIHIKIYVYACSESGFLHSFCVCTGAGTGATEQIMCDELWGSKWGDQGKVVVLDNYFAPDRLQYRMFDEHGARTVSTVSLRSRTEKKQASVTKNDFALGKLKGSVEKAIPRGTPIIAHTKVETTKGPYDSHSAIWAGTKVLGFRYNIMFGRNKGSTVQRRLRKFKGQEQTIAALECAIHYIAFYGAVGRCEPRWLSLPSHKIVRFLRAHVVGAKRRRACSQIDTKRRNAHCLKLHRLDASMRLFPVDFRCSGHWYRRLAYWGLGGAMHNLWAIFK